MPKKPTKPYPTFPLTPHASGRWCKKVRGKIHYFTGTADEAIEEYLAVKDDLHAGRTPRRGRMTVGYLVNRYIDWNDDRLNAGEIVHDTFRDYVKVGRHMVDHFGRDTDPEQLRPDDFAKFRLAMSNRYSTTYLRKVVTVTRQMIDWAYQSELLQKMPRFGPGFKTPSQKQRRLERAGNGKKLFAREEIRELIDAADPKWKAIILLGINGGLGNADIARLTLSDVGGEWLDFPRGKTGIDRRIPLWPETQAAIKAAIAARPKNTTSDLVFLSNAGGPLKVAKTGSDLLAQGFSRLVKKAGARDAKGKPKGCHRKGMGFYWLRHTFQTIGDGVKDPVAVSSIMGHADNTMAGQYRETIDDERLKAVTEFVREWLFDVSLD